MEVLTSVRENLDELESFLAAEVAQNRPFLPAYGDVMRAFAFPMSDVRVLIVGQDPYPTPGHAMGMSFSVVSGAPIPRSLTNIFTELVSDVGCARPTGGDLTPWVKQGVMLLNRVLTVEHGRAGSHQGKGWEAITQCAISALVQRGGPLVAVLWGRQAQVLAPRLGSTPIVASAHPSPLSASQGFFGSRPFTRVNDLLRQQGARPIHWCLP